LQPSSLLLAIAGWASPLATALATALTELTWPLDSERLDVKTSKLFFLVNAHIAIEKVIKKRVKTPLLTQTILCISLAGIGLFFVSIIKPHIT
jgi:hypothetical protein